MKVNLNGKAIMILSDEEKLKIRQECSHSETGNLISCDFADAIERAVLAKVSQQASIPDGWTEDWNKQVMSAWACVRKNDSRIPDDYLDLMRDILLSAAKK